VKPFHLFEVIVAFRFMREGLMQTLLIVVGVGLGGGVIVFMSAMLSGLQANVVRRTLNYQAPIVILPPEQVARPLRDEAGRHAVQVQPRAQSLRSIDQWQHIRDKVGRMAEVVAITPIVAGPGFALRGDASKSITITGIEPETYYRVISLDEKIVLGHRALGPLDIIIGTELANDLGSAIGDRV
jgi:lipoprotein-releasing system permease protein